MKGTGVGATYDREPRRAVAAGQAHITVTPDAAGGGAVDATSSTAGWRAPTTTSSSRAPPASPPTPAPPRPTRSRRYLDEKGEKIQQLQLREHSRITGTGAGAQLMTARHIDLIYAADGRTLQTSKLMEGSVIELPGAGGARRQRIAGTTIDTTHVARRRDGRRT